jgi:hypothetical protein
MPDVDELRWTAGTVSPPVSCRRSSDGRGPGRMGYAAGEGPCGVSNISPQSAALGTWLHLSYQVLAIPPGDEGCFARHGVLSWCRDPLELQSRTNSSSRRSDAISLSSHLPLHSCGRHPQTPSPKDGVGPAYDASCASSGTLRPHAPGTQEAGREVPSSCQWGSGPLEDTHRVAALSGLQTTMEDNLCASADTAASAGKWAPSLAVKTDRGGTAMASCR